MAKDPVTGFIVGSTLYSTEVLAQTHRLSGRRALLQIALIVAFAASLVCAYA